MIHVLATITVAAGRRDAFLDQFRKIIAEVRAEDGCIAYGPAVDADTGLAGQHRLGEDRVVIVEQWRDLAALKAHAVAPHMLAYRERVKGLALSTELVVLEPV